MASSLHPNGNSCNGDTQEENADTSHREKVHKFMAFMEASELNNKKLLERVIRVVGEENLKNLIDVRNVCYAFKETKCEKLRQVIEPVFATNEESKSFLENVRQHLRKLFIDTIVTEKFKAFQNQAKLPEVPGSKPAKNKNSNPKRNDDMEGDNNFFKIHEIYTQSKSVGSPDELTDMVEVGQVDEIMDLIRNQMKGNVKVVSIPEFFCDTYSRDFEDIKDNNEQDAIKKDSSRQELVLYNAVKSWLEKNLPKGEKGILMHGIHTKVRENSEKHEALKARNGSNSDSRETTNDRNEDTNGNTIVSSMSQVEDSAQFPSEQREEENQSQKELSSSMNGLDEARGLVRNKKSNSNKGKQKKVANGTNKEPKHSSEMDLTIFIPSKNCWIAIEAKKAENKGTKSSARQQLEYTRNLIEERANLSETCYFVPMTFYRVKNENKGKEEYPPFQLIYEKENFVAIVKNSLEDILKRIDSKRQNSDDSNLNIDQALDAVRNILLWMTTSYSSKDNKSNTINQWINDLCPEATAMCKFLQVSEELSSAQNGLVDLNKKMPIREAYLEGAMGTGKTNVLVERSKLRLEEKHQVIKFLLCYPSWMLPSDKNTLDQNFKLLKDRIKNSWGSVGAECIIEMVSYQELKKKLVECSTHGQHVFIDELTHINFLDEDDWRQIQEVRSTWKAKNGTFFGDLFICGVPGVTLQLDHAFKECSKEMTEPYWTSKGISDFLDFPENRCLASIAIRDPEIIPVENKKSLLEQTVKEVTKLSEDLRNWSNQQNQPEFSHIYVYVETLHPEDLTKLEEQLILLQDVDVINHFESKEDSQRSIANSIQVHLVNFDHLRGSHIFALIILDINLLSIHTDDVKENQKHLREKSQDLFSSEYYLLARASGILKIITLGVHCDALPYRKEKYLKGQKNLMSRFSGTTNINYEVKAVEGRSDILSYLIDKLKELSTVKKPTQNPKKFKSALIIIFNLRNNIALMNAFVNDARKNEDLKNCKVVLDGNLKHFMRDPEESQGGKFFVKVTAENSNRSFNFPPESDAFYVLIDCNLLGAKDGQNFPHQSQLLRMGLDKFVIITLNSYIKAYKLVLQPSVVAEGRVATKQKARFMYKKPRNKLNPN